MNDKEALLILEQLNDYITKGIETKLKNVVRTTTATVSDFTDGGGKVVVKFPYSNKLLTIPNKTSDALVVGNEVIVGYWGSLSNAFVMMRK